MNDKECTARPCGLSVEAELRKWCVEITRREAGEFRKKEAQELYNYIKSGE